jgi:hypothetical protein
MHKGQKRTFLIIGLTRGVSHLPITTSLQFTAPAFPTSSSRLARNREEPLTTPRLQALAWLAMTIRLARLQSSTRVVTALNNRPASIFRSCQTIWRKLVLAGSITVREAES